MPIPSHTERRLRICQAVTGLALAGLMGAIGFVGAQFQAMDRYEAVLRAHLRSHADGAWGESCAKQTGAYVLAEDGLDEPSRSELREQVRQACGL